MRTQRGVRGRKEEQEKGPLLLLLLLLLLPWLTEVMVGRKARPTSTASSRSLSSSQRNTESLASTPHRFIRWRAAMTLPLVAG